MEAAEELMARLDHQLLYPMEFVIFRVTGYRPETEDRDAKVMGKALARDLVVFVQAVSAEIHVAARSDRGQAIPLDEVARRLGITRRTLQRHRGDGLVLHWVVTGSGERFLGCFPDALERFLERNPGRVRPNWNRTTAVERRDILARAQRLAAEQGSSLDAVAGIIALECGRARSTIRRILRTAEPETNPPRFAERDHLSEQSLAICRRARSVGISLERCARRFGRSPSALHRALLRDRVRRLRGLSLNWSSFTTFARPDAAEVLLGPRAMQQDLPGPKVVIDPFDLPVSAGENRARRLVASHWLMARAVDRLRNLGRQPSTTAVDAIETDLRWCGRLRAAVALEGLPSALQAGKHWRGREVTELPRETARRELRRALEACWTVVDTLEPRRAERLESRCVSLMDRQLSQRTASSRSLASVRHEPGRLTLEIRLCSLVPWAWLEPVGDWIDRSDRVDPTDRAWALRRWGLAGHRPWSTADLMREYGTTATSVQRRLSVMERRMRLNAAD